MMNISYFSSSINLQAMLERSGMVLYSVEGYMNKERIIFHRVVRDSIFTEDFNPFLKNNEIEFSASGLAVAYAPNGVGKTSLSKVLAEGAGENLSFEYDGMTDGENIFHVIKDQNGRNIIKGEAGEFFIGLKIRDIEEFKKALEDRFYAIRTELADWLKNHGISSKSHPFVEVCRLKNGLLGEYAQKLANRMDKGDKIDFDTFTNLGRWLVAQEDLYVIEYDEKKLAFFKDNYKSGGIVDRILNLDTSGLDQTPGIKKIEQNIEAIKILSKFHDMKDCIVCDTPNINVEKLLHKKSSDKDSIIASLDERAKTIVNSIIESIDDNDPFQIKHALYTLLEKGDSGSYIDLKNELQQYLDSICNEFITRFRDEYDKELEFRNKQRTFFWLYREYKKLVSDNNVEFIGDGEKFIRNVVKDIMGKDIILHIEDADHCRRLVLFIDDSTVLDKDRNELPLSTGEQNFISLAFELLRAKRSGCRIVVLDDPISSFDSIYKNKIAYLILSVFRDDNPKMKRCLLFSHNIDLLRLLDVQIGGCFSLYILNNTDGGMNGFIPVLNEEKNLLLYIPSLLEMLRTTLCPDDINDERLFLISMVPFIRGIAKMYGYEKSWDRLSQIMHGSFNRRVNVSSAYRKMILRTYKSEMYPDKPKSIGYIPSRDFQLTADKLMEYVKQWYDDGCRDILNPSKYSLLNHALKHTISYLYLRMHSEKVLCSRFGVDGSKMQFGEICRKAMKEASAMYPSAVKEIEEWKAGLLSKKSLVNEFNHYEGSLNIFQPAIDISDETLANEFKSIEEILKDIELVCNHA